MGQTAKLMLLLTLVAAVACSRTGASSDSAAQPSSAGASQASTPSASQKPGGPASFQPPAYEAALPEGLRAIADKTFTGDLDQMVRRRLIRVGAPFNRTYYFIDGGVQRGLSYDYSQLFQDQLNKQFNTGNLKVNVILLPMRRDELIPQLRAGKIDAVVAQLTVTPEQQKVVAFSDPTRTNVNEVLVTGPAAPSVAAFADLGKASVFVRKSSTYYDSLQAYNARQRAAGKPTITIVPAPESLEDDDLLEMVNAGLIPATVVDNYLAAFWKQVFPHLVVHDDLTVRTGGELAVAYRQGNPQLGTELNAFIAKNALGTVMWRILSQRYLQSTEYVKSAASQADRQRFLDMVGLFRKYGDEYSFDYLLMAAQGFQESGLNQNAKSAVGAVGVMQLMPSTGDAQDVGDIRQVDPNVHAGVKYMRFMRNQYFEGQPMDDLNKGLFTFAAYNAGPGKIDALRREAAQRGLNPNVWFGNVEQVASERIGRQTVTYVSNIYKYYVAYKLIAAQNQAQRAAESEIAGADRR